MKNMKKVREGVNVTPTAPKGVIYVRVSDPGQVAGTSLDEQERLARQYCKERDMEVAHVFREEGASAKTTNRPELIQALDYCRVNKGKVAAFVVWKVDRFARNVGDHFAVRAQLTSYGVRLHSVTEQIGDSAMDKLAETIYAAFAEFDNEIRKTRVVNGMRARIASGIWPFKAPVGYRNRSLNKLQVKKTDPDPVDPNVFPVLQRVLKGFAKQIYTQKNIVEELEKANFHALSGTKPTLQFVDRLLSEENLYFYAGILRDAFGDEYEFHPGKHVPMISEKEMRQIVLIRSGASGRVVRDRHNPIFPLRRLITCLACGQALTGSCPKGRKGHYAYYHCYNKACPMRGKSIPKADLEGKFAGLMTRLKPTDKFMGVLTESVAAYWDEQMSSYLAGQTAHEDAVRGLKAKKARVYEMAEEGTYTAADARERLEAIALDITREELALAAMNVEEFDPKASGERAKKALDYVMANILDIDPALRQRFQKIAFPIGIPFGRESGFGTVKTARIFELNRTFATTGSLKVRRAGFEPAKAKPIGLQPILVDHLSTDALPEYTLFPAGFQNP